MKDFSTLSSKDFILIKGAGLHNLKNIDVAIPRNQLVVITGLSGSGKSSLAFDTLYAEGQRRYVESLSSYARQFLGKHNKPKVDYIKGIAPAIAIEQKVNSSNPRSTVGTTTEIYDYLKLLFARIGKTYSPYTGNLVKKHDVKDVLDFIISLPEKSKLLLLSPYHVNERDPEKILQILAQQGYARIMFGNEVYNIEDVLPNELPAQFYITIDRIIVKNDEEYLNRIADSIQTAFYEGKGTCVIHQLTNQENTLFSNKFELDGLTFLEPNVHFFSFNNPYGACPTCEGYGSTIGIDEELVIPNTSKSIYDDCIAPWKTETFKEYKDNLINHAFEYDIPIHKPWHELTKQQKKIIWEGTKAFEGIDDYFKFLEEQSYKVQYRVLLSKYRGKTICKTCDGTRLRPETNNVKINHTTLSELVVLPMNELQLFFNQLTLNEHDNTIAKRLLVEIKSRIQFLNNVGLSYLTLNRASNTLSGGESQRINLATSLGSSLIGSMYILDEPSIGLHPKDGAQLIEVLQNLKKIGNTVIVVEHDEDMMKCADYIIDIGPDAGIYGGELVAEGTYEDFLKFDTHTANYLSKKDTITIPTTRRPVKFTIDIEGARENNLKNINVKIPLQMLTVITGVSGSGKSTLVKNILYPSLQKHIFGYGNKIGQVTNVSGRLDLIKNIEFIDQNPIGKSSRSNPITYLKAYDDIRALFADEKLAKLRNYQTKHFSFNVDGGRCDTCKGEGEVTIEMQFMADVHLPCETCEGKRFKKEVLEIKFQDKNIADILDLSVDEAIDFFKTHQQNKIVKKLQPLQDVGLGYVALGQSSSTLSGGEAQRIKLASFLVKGIKQETSMFIFDEPTTGLHFHDIKKLIKSFNALIKNGHSLVVIEHNLDLIKCADYIIDIGPEGGKNGGNIVFTGTPEQIIQCKDSYTGQFLIDKLN